jgi:hypothetical protein
VCFSYSDTVTLQGTLERRTFPGPPNYESIHGGDQPETGFYLELPRPICTLASGGSEARENVRTVQLVLDSAGYDRLRPSIGRRTTVRGVLFSSLTGHHHAPLLLEVARPSSPRRSNTGFQRTSRGPAVHLASLGAAARR